MAEKIHSFYLKAEQIGGIKARARLSMLTAVDSYQAKTLPDTEDTIMIFEKAIKKIVKEFNTEAEDNSLRLKVIKLLLNKAF